nr:retrovirus-related Pol polyprotein from transposon TNT 1-94 [Tanacetum cinerariifolium]
HQAGQKLVTCKWLFKIKEGIEGVQKPRSYAPGEYIYLLLYVDDMLIACKSKAEFGSTKSLLKREFDIKDLEEAKKILGMEIVRDRSRKILRVSRSGYISKILNIFRIDNGKSVQMPLDVDLEALTDPDGYILGDKGAGLSQRESSVSVNMLQNQLVQQLTDTSTDGYFDPFYL